MTLVGAAAIGPEARAPGEGDSPRIFALPDLAGDSTHGTMRRRPRSDGLTSPGSLAAAA